MEYYSAVKRSKILKSVGKWMEVENIKLSEFAQAQKAKYWMLSFICGPSDQQLLGRYLLPVTEVFIY